MAMTDFISKLKTDVRNAEELVEAARIELEKAELAGLDMTAQRAKYDKAVDTLNKIKAVYIGV